LWLHEAPRTISIILDFDLQHFHARYVDGIRSPAELSCHIEDSILLAIACLSGSLAARNRARLAEQPSAAARGLTDAFSKLQQTLTQLSQTDFGRPISPFGTVEPLGLMAFGMFKHEIHHRGQLFLLAQIAGLKCEGLYANTRLQTPQITVDKSSNDEFAGS
jgi:uncharacterized damage-inducible protein DinB